jgi:RNA polymerase sigma factor (sigma-70 family)
VDRASTEPDRSRAALALLAAHERRLRRIARRLSICADDADDALQRAVEILLTKAPALEPERLLAWMTVVTKREAMAVRRSRERLLAPRLQLGDGMLPDRLETTPCELPGPAERAERSEVVAEAYAALAALKPNERLAVLLQAQGYSYAEICALCGWTYTKVNRCLAEGRAALRARDSRAAAGR